MDFEESSDGWYQERKTKKPLTRYKEFLKKKNLENWSLEQKVSEMQMRDLDQVEFEFRWTFAEKNYGELKLATSGHTHVSNNGERQRKENTRAW